MVVYAAKRIRRQVLTDILKQETDSTRMLMHKVCDVLYNTLDEYELMTSPAFLFKFFLGHRRQLVNGDAPVDILSLASQIP